MAEDLGEKSEQPTAKRMSEARRDGNVARSSDLSSALLLSAGVLLVFVFAQDLFVGAMMIVERSLSPEFLGRGVRTQGVIEPLRFTFGSAARIVAPLLLLFFVIATALQFLMVGWNLTLKPLQPKFDRLSINQGIKRIISKRTIVKALVNVGKLIVVATIVITAIDSRLDRIVVLPVLTLPAIVLAVAQMVLEVALWAILALLIIGIIDFTYQKWQHNEELKMTKQEVKDERKSAEGDPKVKAQRFRLARQIALQRLGASVPQADVVVTNPTHYAVAIRYNADTMHAPRVVTKGVDHLAIRIRLIASANGIPIVERPPLARALYANVEPGQEIPVEQYEAVAEVLAYIYRLEGRAVAT